VVRARPLGLVIALASLFPLAPAAVGATVKSFPITAGGPHAVAPSSDGSSVFVGARDCGYVGRFDTAANGFSVFLSNPPLPCTADLSGSGRGPFSAVQGPDGKLYFTIYDPDPIDGFGAIARVNTNGTNLETKAVGIHPLDLTVGPDGNVWFAINGPPGRVGRIVPATFALTEFAIPGNPQGPRGIVSGGDGNLYVLGGEAGMIWRVTTAGAITPVASSLEGPSFGELGPDGKIWFTLFEGNGVTTFDPATSNVGTTTAVPGGPWDVAFGADGKAYATRFNENSIAQIVPGQTGFTSLPLPTTSGFPVFIASSPDGNLYAAGKGENTLFQIAPDRPALSATGPPTAADTDPPNTKLKKKPRKRSHDKTPTFKATSDEPGSKFRCKLDRGRFKSCKARKTFHVKPGVHTVQIAAVDRAGNVDPTPVRFKFTVLG
jgi:streptogramin lyase